MRKKRYLYIAVILVLAIASLFLLKNRGAVSQSKNGLIKIKNFSYVEPGAITCQAIAPGCGVCYGSVIDKQCYVTQAQFDDYKKVYPSLEAD